MSAGAPASVLPGPWPPAGRADAASAVLVVCGVLGLPRRGARPLSRRAVLVLTPRGARDFRVVAGALVVLALVQGASGGHPYLTATGASSMGHTSYIGHTIRAVGTFGPLDVTGMATVVGYGLMVALALAPDPAPDPDPDAPRRQGPAALVAPAVVLLGAAAGALLVSTVFAGAAALALRAPAVPPLLVAVKGELAHAR